MTLSHIKGLPTVIKCHLFTATHSCTIPRTATSYNYIIGILVTKAVILPAALVTELIVSFQIARVSMHKHTKVENRNKYCSLFMKTIAIWQLLVFIQITIGLISIPLIVLTLISPARVLLLCGELVLYTILIIFILTTIPIPTSCKFQPIHFLGSCFLTAETISAVALIVSAYFTYQSITIEGMNMSGVKGYILSLIPAIPIPIFVWMFKKKFLREKRNKFRNKQLIKKENELKDVKSLEKGRETLSTEDEEDYNCETERYP